jgi:hypothetical protein
VTPGGEPVRVVQLTIREDGQMTAGTTTELDTSDGLRTGEA